MLLGMGPRAVSDVRPPPVRCSVSFYNPEGYIDSTDYPPLPLHSFLECTYNVTVYTGYGVELQVRNASGVWGSARLGPPAPRQQGLSRLWAGPGTAAWAPVLAKSARPGEKIDSFLGLCNK